MATKKIRLGLVGKDVSKSLSGQMHTFILNAWGIECEYESFSIPQEEFDGVARRLLGDFDGFNITIPYKRDVMGYLNEIVGDAFDFGAVNTVISPTGVGYNTDGAGFLLMLRAAGIEVENKKVLVLGGGGSGRSSAAALKKAGAKVCVYQRNKEKLSELCNELGVQATQDPEEGGYDIVINCTGVGMHDSEGRSPVTEKAFMGATWAVDLIYEPKQSSFLQLAKGKGVNTLNGEAMLFYQAYFADCIYLNKTPLDEEAKMLYENYKKEERL